MEELSGVEEQWRLIGRELHIMGAGSGKLQVDDINYPDTTDCLREVFKRWLQYSGTTWRDIIVALRKAGEPQLADNLQSKYIPGELTHNIHLSLNMRNVYCYIVIEWTVVVLGTLG